MTNAPNRKIALADRDRMEVVTTETPSLGDRSYLVHDGTVALVVDPQGDLDRVLIAAEEAGVEITHLAETHLHNDYVSGGPAMSVPATCTPSAESLTFDRSPVVGGDVIEVGDLLVEVPTHGFGSFCSLGRVHG